MRIPLTLTQDDCGTIARIVGAELSAARGG